LEESGEDLGERIDWLAAKFSRTARALFIAPLGARGMGKNSLAVINYSQGSINKPTRYEILRERQGQCGKFEDCLGTNQEK